MDALLQYTIAGCIVVVGLVVYWRLKWVAREKLPQDSFGTFFLAGEKVGQELTTHNSWGLGFAFANAVWYFAYLGYNFGPWAFVLQLPWVLAVAGLGVLFNRYLKASQCGTVHGFIRRQFGGKAGTMAAVATLTGYCLNVGFEMFYSAHLLTTVFSIQYIEFVLAILIAIFAGAYCTAGGYYASVVTDKYQNILGTIAMLLLIACLMPSYISATGNWLVFTTQTSPATMPWHFIVGVSVFAFFFNFVDMANWQSLAANRALPECERNKVRVGLLISAAVQFVIPAFAGVWLGAMIKGITSGLADDQILSVAINSVFQSAGPFGGVVLGIVIFGFLSLTLSSAGSYLVAAMQTLAVDIVKRDELDKFEGLDTVTEEQLDIEQETLSWVKRNIIVAAVVSVSVFAVLYYGLDWAKSTATVFQFQFVMYGAAVALVPVVLGRLFGASVEAPRSNSGGFSSILIGLLAAVIPFLIAAFFWNAPWLKEVRDRLPTWANPESIINLTPLLGLSAAVITFVLFQWVSRVRSKTSRE